MKVPNLKKWIAWISSVVLLAVLFLPIACSAAPVDDTLVSVEGTGEDPLDSVIVTDSYSLYYAGIADYPAAESTVVVKACDYTSVEGNSAERLAEYKGTANVLMVANEEGRLTYQLTVPTAGRYTVLMRYYPINGNERSLELGLLIDGKTPFPGAEGFQLSRQYQNETEIQTDSNDNQYAPRQVEYFGWFTDEVKPMTGLVDDAAEMYLTAGEHTLTVCTLSQPYVLDTITFAPPSDLPTYAEYCGQYLDNGGEDFIKIEAEDAIRKSDQNLRPASDRTSPLSSPYHASKIRMNILSSSWAQPGQWLEWDFEAPSDGYYYLGFRYQQYYNIDFFVTRRLMIDGEIPFEEAKSLRFDYDLDWKYETLSTNGEKLKVYLTKGKHTLRMEAALGDYAELLDSLNEVVAELNELYRQIIIVTGVTPDQYQDYYLDKEVPGLMETLEWAHKTLVEQYERIKEITDSTGAQASHLNVFAKQLESFLAEPDEIPSRISSFNSNIGSLAAWVLDLRSQPMDMDYIYLYQEDADQPRAKPTFWQVLWHEIMAFFASFFEDYDSMESEAEGVTIDVWVGSSREHVQIIRDMIDDLYTPTHNVNVNLKLVNAGMVEAFLSGRTPDVALTVGRGQPLNLSVRGALLDLTQFSDFDEAASEFLPGALEPYYFENGCFALPDTQSFYMMFYRTDIFEELGISPPNTWEEFRAVISTIQRFNMEVGVPYTSVDAMGAADAGLGVRNIFPALLMQNGGSVYTDDKSGTALGTPQAIDAFEQWCELYSQYGLPVSYNFYNRFRTGEMPLAIATYTEFARLESAAPEIRGLWKMVPIPGTRQSDGSVDRSQAGAGTSCVILSKTEKADAAWDFLKWYCSAEAQSRYAKDVEAQMGMLARVAVANTEALASLSWTREQYAAIVEQRKYVRELPEVLGGYYVTRGLDNAFREVVYEQKNARESLVLYNAQINAEIKRKREEFGLE